MSPEEPGLGHAHRRRMTDLDEAHAREMPGRELPERGLSVGLPDKPSARIVTDCARRSRCSGPPIWS
jgi:hypothetical protein